MRALGARLCARGLRHRQVVRAQYASMSKAKGGRSRRRLHRARRCCTLLVMRRILLLVTVFPACAPVYMRPAANAPFFQGGGEAQASGQLGMNGVDVQGAYAITDHIGVLAASSFSNGNKHSHAYGEAGAGYYVPLADVVSLEVFAGGGAGSSQGNSQLHIGETETEIQARGSYALGFVQADLGLATEAVDLGLTTRGSYLRYWFTHLDGQAVSAHEDQLFIEPTAVARVGWRYVKVGIQAGMILPTREIQRLHFNPLLLHFGVGLHLRWPGGA